MIDVRIHVRVLRNISSLTFMESADDLLEQEYGQYRDAVDQVLANGNLF